MRHGILPEALAVAAALALFAVDARPQTLSPGPSASAPAPAPPVPQLEAAVHAIVADHALAGASAGIAVLDVDSGRILAAHDEHLPLNPASNAKLYTTGAALATLHPEHRYETTLSGRVEGDAVVGPLSIRGFGDPSLTTADLWELVQELRSYGVRRVEGDVVVDQRFFDEQTTPPPSSNSPANGRPFAPRSARSPSTRTASR